MGFAHIDNGDIGFLPLFERTDLVMDLLQKFGWDKAWLTAGLNYAASAVNCCLSDSGAVDPKLPCSFRIM